MPRKDGELAGARTPVSAGGRRNETSGLRSPAIPGTRPQTLSCTLSRALKVGGLAFVSLALAFIVLLLAAYFQLSQVRAQEHHHPPADALVHEKFYSTWMMPDKPDRSCCNRQDCYPTDVRFRDGFWEARRREDGRYVRIPWEKVEQRRDNPDGRKSRVYAAAQSDLSR
jgi:hypothetical protein